MYNCMSNPHEEFVKSMSMMFPWSFDAPNKNMAAFMTSRNKESELGCDFTNLNNKVQNQMKTAVATGEYGMVVDIRKLFNDTNIEFTTENLFKYCRPLADHYRLRGFDVDVNLFDIEGIRENCNMTIRWEI